VIIIIIIIAIVIIAGEFPVIISRRITPPDVTAVERKCMKRRCGTPVDLTAVYAAAYLPLSHMPHFWQKKTLKTWPLSSEQVQLQTPLIQSTCNKSTGRS